jgi:KDO2-lipid IV(A) lauroyltransferase
MDQHMTTGAPLPFLGRPALTATAIPAMCKRSGAVLLPASATRSDDGTRFDIRFEAPITAGDATEMTAAVNRRFEAWVADRPAQWFWLHRRWRQ